MSTIFALPYKPCIAASDPSIWKGLLFEVCT